MNKRPSKINAPYAAAKKRVSDAENQIRLQSEQRLAELTKYPALQRLQHFEDPLLTPPDRAKLRQSIGVNLRREKKELVQLGARYGSRRLWRWFWRRWPSIFIATSVAAPLCFFTLMAWSNTGQVIIAPQPIALYWRLPSGTIERGVLGAGDRVVVVVPQEGTPAQARRWIAGQGYATAPVNIDRHLLQ